MDCFEHNCEKYRHIRHEGYSSIKAIYARIVRKRIFFKALQKALKSFRVKSES